MRLVELRNWFGQAWRHQPPSARPPREATTEAGVDDTDDALALADQPGIGASVWTGRRIALEEELWGEGYMSPGGSEELLRLAVPLGLSAASSLLLVGAGLGGPALTLAAELGVWVTGFEADPRLAAVGQRRVHRAGPAMAKRATMQGWDRANPGFRRRACHHAMAIETIHDGVPERVLSAITDGIKPRGQVVLVETVAPVPLDPADTDVAAWCRLEGRAPVLPDANDVTLALSRLGFDVRVVEDVSARHMRLAVLGWKQLLRSMAAMRPSPRRAEAIVTEAELWMRRVRLMHAGRIRLVRWHAIGWL